MPESTFSILADSLVASLNAREFSQPLTAQRGYLPKFDLQEMQELHATVVPKQVVSQFADRGRSQFEYDIDVGVQKKLQSLEAEEIDPLVALSEEIADQFRGKRLESYPEAICSKATIAPVYAQDHLDQLRQFTSVVTLTYRVWR